MFQVSLDECRCGTLYSSTLRVGDAGSRDDGFGWLLCRVCTVRRVVEQIGIISPRERVRGLFPITDGDGVAEATE